MSDILIIAAQHEYCALITWYQINEQHAAWVSMWLLTQLLLYK